MPIVLFGAEYWDEVIKFDALVKYGRISPSDLDLFHRTDSLNEAYEIRVSPKMPSAVLDRRSRDGLPGRPSVPLAGSVGVFRGKVSCHDVD